MRVLFALIFMLPLTLFSQEDVNQYDAEGKRHGVWKKYFPNATQLRYQGTFNHGKETGVFSFYCESCGDQPSIVKTYSENSSEAHVQYFTAKGKLVSEGKMNGKQRVGEWIYYHKKAKTVMTRETYKAGKLEGLVTTYYTNGKITETMAYVNGLRQGENNYYSPEGVKIKALLFDNDELHGPAIYFNAKGDKILEGTYKRGKKDGLWKHYKNNEVVKEEQFPKPRN